MLALRARYANALQYFHVFALYNLAAHQLNAQQANKIDHVAEDNSNQLSETTYLAGTSNITHAHDPVRPATALARWLNQLHRDKVDATALNE
ncbi:MAG: hypothetical protein F6K47_08155 [Symploca sp. SIO2E6]|nr:hypothetical protein [Symploca sp. SIO2E6]